MRTNSSQVRVTDRNYLSKRSAAFTPIDKNSFFMRGFQIIFDLTEAKKKRSSKVDRSLSLLESKKTFGLPNLKEKSHKGIFKT